MKNSEKQKIFYVAGIDAGGTCTRCQIADDRGRIVSAGYGGPANKNFVSSRSARRSMEHALFEARKPINHRIDIAVVAGPHIPGEAIACISKHAKKVFVTDEFEASLAAGLGKTGGWGAVILSGTGSFCKGRNSRGKEKYTGGWGPLIGDEGSAHDIAREALAALVRAWDGRGKLTMLSDLILSHLKVSEAGELKNILYNPPLKRHKFAELARHVFTAAQEGDEVAAEILTSAGETLAALAMPVFRELFNKHEYFSVILSGGILREKSILSDTLIKKIKKDWPGADVFIPEFQPVTGAVIIALDSAGVKIGAKLIHNLRETNLRVGNFRKRGR